MRTRPPAPCASILFALALVACTCGRLDAGMIYLALGDSNAFGDDESTPASIQPNNGDQGYVKPFADFLRAVNGGVRPQVVNLAISGELSTSFLSGAAPAGWTGRQPQLNTNYSGPYAAASQNSLMMGTLQAARMAGNSVTVTLNIGVNDFYYLVGTPAFQAASAAQQQAMFATLVSQVTMNAATVLTEIRTITPTARIILPGFFNSYPTTDPSYPYLAAATLGANQAIQGIAPNFGATYVDLASVINGRYDQYVNPTLPHHLNQAGYAAVAVALGAAVVPEPSSALLLGIGGAAGLVTLRRRRRAG